MVFNECQSILGYTFVTSRQVRIYKQFSNVLPVRGDVRAKLKILYNMSDMRPKEEKSVKIEQLNIEPLNHSKSSDVNDLFRWILVMIIFGVLCGIILIFGGGKYDGKYVPLSGMNQTTTSTDFTRTTVIGNTTTAERVTSTTSSSASSKNATSNKPEVKVTVSIDKKPTLKISKVQTTKNPSTKAGNSTVNSTTTKSPSKETVSGANLTTIKKLDKLASPTKAPVATNKPGQGTAAIVNNNG